MYLLRFIHSLCTISLQFVFVRLKDNTSSSNFNVDLTLRPTLRVLFETFTNSYMGKALL